MGFAGIVQNLSPNVEWKKSTGSSHAIPELDSYIAEMPVPSSYRDPTTSRIFNVSVQRFMMGNSKPKAHIIFLAGGPGGLGRQYEDVIVDWVSVTKGDLAAYIIDHRGLGGSGRFVNEGVEWPEIAPNIDNIVKAGRFEVSDLTLEYASCDTGMLGLAIKNSEIWDPSARLIIYGFSYGSTWALQSNLLFEGWFDSIIVGGTPAMPWTKSPDLSGLAALCALDGFCSKKIGSNPDAVLRKGARAIVDPGYNECTKRFHDKLTVPMKGSVDKKVRYLGNMLHVIYAKQHKEFKSFRHNTSAQLLMPLFKATLDCVNPDEYEKKILAPLKPLIPSFMSGAGTKGKKQKDSMKKLPRNIFLPILERDGDKKFNAFVNFVTRMDLSPVDYSLGKPPVPSNNDNVHTHNYFRRTYYDAYLVLKPYIQKMNRSKQDVPSSSKSSVIITQSLHDFVTPYGPAREIYQKVRASKKMWVLFNNRPHDMYDGRCLTGIVLAQAFGTADNAYINIEGCIESENAQTSLDWGFTELPPIYQGMWDAVGDAPENSKSEVANIPNFECQGCVFKSFFGLTNILLYIILPTAIMAAAIGYYYYRRRR